MDTGSAAPGDQTSAKDLLGAADPPQEPIAAIAGSDDKALRPMIVQIFEAHRTMAIHAMPVRPLAAIDTQDRQTRAMVTTVEAALRPTGAQPGQGSAGPGPQNAARSGEWRA